LKYRRSDLHLLPTLSRAAQKLPKAKLDAFVDAEQILDYPEDLTYETTAQNGYYAH
jgi:hypothetical protein